MTHIPGLWYTVIGGKSCEYFQIKWVAWNSSSSQYVLQAPLKNVVHTPSTRISVLGAPGKKGNPSVNDKYIEDKLTA